MLDCFEHTVGDDVRGMLWDLRAVEYTRSHEDGRPLVAGVVGTLDVSVRVVANAVDARQLVGRTASSDRVQKVLSEAVHEKEHEEN